MKHSILIGLILSALLLGGCSIEKWQAEYSINSQQHCYDGTENPITCRTKAIKTIKVTGFSKESCEKKLHAQVNAYNNDPKPKHTWAANEYGYVCIIVGYWGF